MKVLWDENALPAMIGNIARSQNGEPIADIRPVGKGGFGSVYEVLSQSGTVQIWKAYQVTDTMLAEAQALRELRKASPLPIPEVYHIHTADEQYPVDLIAMEKISGRNAAGVRLPWSKNKRERFRDILIDSVGAMHRYPCGTRYGLIGDSKKFDSWKAFYQDFYLYVVEHAKDFCANADSQSRKIYYLLQKGLDNLDFILSEPVSKPSLVHGDIWLPNVMVDPNTFTPTGIIDPLHAMWGDNEYDLFPLSAPVKTSLKLYQTYKSRFQTSEKVDLKIALYALVSEVRCNIRSQNRTGKMYYSFLIRRLEKQFKRYGI